MSDEINGLEIPECLSCGAMTRDECTCIERPDDWEVNMNMREFVREALEAKGMKCTGEAGCGPNHSHLIMEMDGFEYRIQIYPLTDNAICVCGHGMKDHIEGFDPCSLCACKQFRDPIQ